MHFLFCLPLSQLCVPSFLPLLLFFISFYSSLALTLLSLTSLMAELSLLPMFNYFSLYPGLFQMLLTVSSLILTIKYFHLPMLGVVMISACTHMSLIFDRKQRHVSLRTCGFSQHFSPTFCHKPFWSRVCAFLPFSQLLILLDAMLS